MFITIAVIAYNEENTIKNILDDISRQDYDHNLMEVVLVDSASTDGTKAVMQKFADENKMGARQIVVLDNPKKTLPCGWNVLLDNYTGEAVIRVDAHAHIPVDFVSKNVKVLEEGEMVVGGVRPNIVDEETPWKDTLLLAESSMFGSSIAPYRNGGNGTGEKIYMKSLFHAAYRREVFDKIGHCYRPEYRKNQDTMLWYDGLMHGVNIANLPNVVLKFRMTEALFKKRRNGWVFAKKQLADRLQINKNLHYGHTADLFAYAMFCLLIAPAWVKKIAYKIFR